MGLECSPLFVAHDAEAALFKADGRKSLSASVPMTQGPMCARAFSDELALRIIQEAQRLFPQAIKFHHNTAVTHVDFKRQLVHLSRDGSNTTEVCTEITSAQDGKVYTVLCDLANLASAQAAILQSSLPSTQPNPKISHWPVSCLTCNAPDTILPVFVRYTANM